MKNQLFIIASPRTEIGQSQPGRLRTAARPGVLVEARALTPCAESFLRMLEGRNCSTSTLKAYGTDLGQLVDWLHGAYSPEIRVDEVRREDIEEYLSWLAHHGRSGVTRARKLAAIREFFAYIEERGIIPRSPADKINSPRREQNARTYLHPDEYTRMLSQACGNPRDYAILQVFLQTGVRVSELCELRLDDVDLVNRVLRVRLGKGHSAREIPLEKKGLQAVRNWLQIRPDVLDDHLFLNQYGQPLGDRGVRKLVAKYCQQAGIIKKASPHSFRHTFVTWKIEQGVNPFIVQDWAGHAKITTTQGYRHPTGRSKQRVMEVTSL
jgi:site-specific recombinase XerD